MIASLSSPNKRNSAHNLYVQAWNTYCREGRLCNGSPELPDKAYVISLPEEIAKRSPLLSALADLGLTPEYVDGILSDQVDIALLDLNLKCTSHTSDARFELSLCPILFHDILITLASILSIYTLRASSQGSELVV